MRGDEDIVADSCNVLLGALRRLFEVCCLLGNEPRYVIRAQSPLAQLNYIVTVEHVVYDHDQ